MNTTTPHLTYPETTYPIACRHKLEAAKLYVILNAIKMMQEHKLAGWSFKISNHKGNLGYCNYTEKTLSISITNIWVNPWSQVKNTILHEIAHALASKKGDWGHGDVWRQIAISIGCDGHRCSPMPAPKKYIGICGNCGTTFGRNRQTKNLHACARCCDKYNGGKFTERFLLTWKLNPNHNVPTVREVIYRA